MKLFLLTAIRPLDGRERQHRGMRYLIMAESEEAAKEKVKYEESSKNPLYILCTEIDDGIYHDRFSYYSKDEVKRIIERNY